MMTGTGPARPERLLAAAGARARAPAPVRVVAGQAQTFRYQPGYRLLSHGCLPWPGPRRARRKLFVVRAKVVPDRVIRRRSIRMIRAAPPVPRRVLRNRGLTVVAAPADTGYTIRLENIGTGLAHGRPRRRGTDRPRHRRLPRAQPRSPSSACRRPAGVRDEPQLPPGIAAFTAGEAGRAPARPSSRRDG